MKQLTYKLILSGLRNLTLTILILGYLQSTSFSQQLQKVLDIEWKSAQHLTYENGPWGNNSFRSFEWIESENSFAFLSGVHNEIVIINPAQKEKQEIIKLNYYPRFFTYSQNKFYLLTQDKIHILNRDGSLNESLGLPEVNGSYFDFKVIDDHIYILKSSGETISVNDNSSILRGWPLLNGEFAQTNKLDGNSYKIITYDNRNKIINEQRIEFDKTVASAIIIGANDKYFFVETVYLLSEVPIKTNKQLEIFKKDSIGKDAHQKTVTRDNLIDLPNNNFTYTKNDILVTKKGIMSSITSVNGIHIFHIPNTKVLTEQRYPSSLIRAKINHTDYSRINKLKN